MIRIVNQQISINNKIIEMNNLKFKRSIGKGANGIVFFAHDELLNRNVAVKFWTSLKTGDQRNKVSQGISEARKHWIAQEQRVALLHNSGIINNVFYTIMEFVDGVTLKEFLLEKSLSFGTKTNPFSKTIFIVLITL